jgi:hypothetical protein
VSKQYIIEIMDKIASKSRKIIQRRSPHISQRPFSNDSGGRNFIS